MTTHHVDSRIRRTALHSFHAAPIWYYKTLRLPIGRQLPEFYSLRISLLEAVQMHATEL